MRRKITPAIERGVPRPVVPARTTTGGVLRAVLLAAVASGAVACDPLAPRQWPDDVTRTARKVGVFLRVIAEPIALAGEAPAVVPMPVPSASASAAPSSSAP